MTIRISKPAFNLRDKISELDTDRLSHEKLPSGSIIQQQRLYDTTAQTLGAKTSPYALFTINFYPKRVDSYMHISTHVSWAHTGMGTDDTDHYDVFMFTRRHHDGVTSYIGVNSNLTRSWGHTNNNAWYKTDVPPSNDAVTHGWAYFTMPVTNESIDKTPHTLSMIQYDYSVMCQNGFYLNRSKHNTTNGGASSITITEIAF